MNKIARVIKIPEKRENLNDKLLRITASHSFQYIKLTDRN